MNKISKVLLLYVFASIFSGFSLAGALSGSAVYSLDSEPYDMVFDGTNVYISSRDERLVWQINVSTGEKKSLSFTRTPEELYVRDGKLFVTLADKPHSSFWWEEEQAGAFAVISCGNFSLIKQNIIRMDPFDIVVSKSGIVYISSGSGQWTNICSYTQDGVMIETASIRQMSYLAYNEPLNCIYATDTDSSPRDISVYKLGNDGSFSDSYDSPYHGDFDMSPEYFITPDGRYALNTFGFRLDCSNTKDDDMVMDSVFSLPFLGVCFDTASKIGYIGYETNEIIKFSYDDFSTSSKYLVRSGDLLSLVNAGRYIAALTLGADNEFLLEIIDSQQPYDPVAESKFDDIKNHAWAADAINNLTAMGIIKGTSGTTYSPAQQMKRCDFILLMVRTFGLRKTTSQPYDDVSPHAYYYDELNIAKACNIMPATSDNKFHPEEPILREDMMLYLYNAMKAANVNLPAGSAAVLDRFSDALSISAPKIPAIVALIDAGLIEGSGNMIYPLNTTTRAEVAVFLNRAVSYIYYYY